MPGENHMEDLRPCTNLKNEEKSSKNDENRLKKLEKEVKHLRDEVDKIKWQKATAETAIEHAISRGAVALGDRYKILIPGLPELQGSRSRRECTNRNTASNKSIASGGSWSSNGNSQKNGTCPTLNPIGNSVKEKKDHCGQYTIG